MPGNLPQRRDRVKQNHPDTLSDPFIRTTPYPDTLSVKMSALFDVAPCSAV